MVPDFIYFVNLDDFLVSINFGNTSKLSSSTLAHIESYKENHPVYSVDPDKMLTDMDALKGFASPRLSYVKQACWLKNGFKLGIGVENTKFYSDADHAKIIRIAELEVEIEKTRRKINPQLPSRLICLFLAEDDYEGRTMLKNMFFNKRSFCIVPVKIICAIRFHRADSKWIDEYERTKDKVAIENYWEGIPFDKNPQYEYLLDGQIELLNSEDKEYILTDYKIRHKELFPNSD
jgi:hypothetical protein